MKVYDGSERIGYTMEEEKRVKRRVNRVIPLLTCGCYISSVKHTLLIVSGAVT